MGLYYPCINSYLTPESPAWGRCRHRSPVKDQLVEAVLFDFPAEARKRTIGGRRSQPRDLGGDLRRNHNFRDDNDRLGWRRRQAQNGGSPDGGPMVRILLPPLAGYGAGGEGDGTIVAGK